MKVVIRTIKFTVCKERGFLMEIQKGTIKKEIAKLEIRDYEVSNIIINALVEKGYDLVSKPISDGMKMQIGEQITIYKIEQRQ